MALARDIGGQGRPLLVLLHGLGATRQIWEPMRPRLSAWPGRWVAFDLPGHGASPRAMSYTLELTAEAVADAIRMEADGALVALLGHSMGAAIALALASGWFELQPTHVLGLGLKTVWTSAELEGLERRAHAPAKRFDTFEAATEMFLKVSGLAGLLPLYGEIAASGVQSDGDGWRLAMDPRANGVTAPPMAGLSAASVAPVALACGALDPMSDVDDLKRWDPHLTVFPGIGHNAMVQAPDIVWRWASHHLQTVTLDA